MTTFKLLLLALLAAPVFAFSAEKIVEVSGSGASKEQAIEAALVRAIAQVKGISIDSDTLRVASQVRTNGDTNTSVAMSSATAMKTKGLISNYEVLESECFDSCDVLLRVTVPVYKSPGLSTDKRRKLVVAPFEGEYGKRFSDSLQSALVQARRFAVLDREHNSEYEAEKRLLMSSDTALEEKMRLGQVLGVDYLIVGSVSFEDNSFQGTSSYTGESSYVEDMHSEVNYKVINLATRQVKWQDTVRIEEHVNNPFVAQAISRSITGAIYPMKIVSNQNATVVLNQGGTSVIVGEKYDVFKLGEKLIDPYTKESLGREEIFIGQVQVNKVTSKVSYAIALDSDVNAMTVGSIVRPSVAMEASSHAAPVVDSTVQSSTAGGILLPLPAKKAPKPSPKGGVLISN
jgi:hypothetical protein